MGSFSVFMSAEVVIDIETQNIPASEGNFRDVKVALVGVFTYDEGQFRAFREEELGELWPILERAERIIGFNTEHFDLPILNNYYPGNLLDLPQLDILKVVHGILGFRIKLNDLAKATLQVEKSGQGLQAMQWFAAGEWGKIEKYCLDDVRITRDLYEYGKKNRQLFFSDPAGIKPFPVNFALQKKEAAQLVRPGFNLTLPL